MDFQQLMRKAQANQTVKEKRHERTRQDKEVAEQREREEEERRKREIEEKLQRRRREAERRMREYKGVSGVGTPSKVKHHSSSEDSVMAKSKGSTTSFPAKSPGKPLIPAPSTKSPGKHLTSASSTKAPGKHLTPTLSATKHEGKRVTESNGKKATKPPPSASSTSSSSSSSLSAKSKAKAGPPMNFMELMKLAVKKTEKDPAEPPDGEEGVAPGGTSKRGRVSPGPRNCSPVGKSLIESASARLKTKRSHDAMERGAGKEPHGMPGATSITNGTGANGSTDINPDLCTSLEVSRRGVATSKGGEASTKGAIPGRPANSRFVEGGATGGKSLVGGARVPDQPAARDSPSLARKSLLLRRQRELERRKAGGTKPGRPSARPAQTGAFYGASSARLIMEDRPQGSGQRGPAHYRSSWVDEMSEQFQRGRGGESEEEEEEEEDDFVVGSDEEVEGEGEDYSDAIRQIFGYDKRRYAEERFDDSLMESSYAQQMFEEQRSSRIGRQEDAEDLRMEQAQTSHKRRKKGEGGGGGGGGGGRGGGVGVHQTKLKFR